MAKLGQNHFNLFLFSYMNGNRYEGNRNSSSLHSRMCNKNCTVLSRTQRKHLEEHPQEWQERNHFRNPCSCGPKPMTWRSFEASLVPVLQNSLRGSAASRLSLFGYILYEEGTQKFRAKPKRRIRPKQIGRRQIHQLVKERRLLRTSWRKATEKEKEGLRNLWDQIKASFAHLRRAGRILKRRSRKEKARASFLKDPFRYAYSLLEEGRFGNLRTTEQELEDFIQSQLSDSLEDVPLGPPGYVPQPPEPSSLIDTSPPKWSKVKHVINGIPYRV